MKEKFSKVLVILVISLFLEVIVFNITSYRTLFGNYEKKVCENPEFLYYEDDGKKVALKFDEINVPTATVKIELNKVPEITEYQIYFSDDTSTQYKVLNTKKYIPTYEKSKYMPLYLSGDTKGLVVLVDRAIYDSGNFKQIVVNEKIPFEFNFIRFGIVFAILSLAYFFKNEKIFNSEYSYKNLKQEFILLGALAVFFVILTFINIYSENKAEGKIYNESFVNAIMNKQLYLIEEPSQEFLSLEDPYDDLARRDLQRDKDYIWDTAFYNGKQYIYFGILPLLISFLPYFLITGKYLQISVVVFAFSILIFILLKEILTKIFKLYFKNVQFKFVLYSLIILCSGTLILYANGMSRVYELVIVAGLYFVLQGLYFILKSIENEEKKYFNIFLGSLCLALSVACRPTDLIASLVIVPYLINLLIINVKKVKETKLPLVKLIISVAVPYLTVGIALMYYNYIRFGSVFEFGAKYQLTITNMTKLGSRLWAIPTGIITNLFSMPNFILKFPFIDNHNDLITFYGYYYIENMIGGLFILAPICFMNFYIIKANKISENKSLKIIINSLFIVGLVIAVMSIMMAGSNQRYLIDYAWMIILAGILIFIVIYNNLKTDEAKKILQKFLCIITVYTFLIGISAGIVSEKNYMRNNSPEVYYKLQYTICFWE